MAICLGDSVLLSMNGASRVACSSPPFLTVAVPPLSKHGDQYRLPLAVHPASRKRLPAIRATKSGSVDAPESSSSPSINTSNESQAQSHLDLLERLTENSTASQGDDVRTIRDQLSSQVEPEAAEVVVPLTNGQKDTPVAELTISQKRNIRRQNYLNKVSERNDAPFFAAIAAFVLVPPILILGFAVATGYVELFP